MYKNIVLLDAGHGGKDSGAVNGSYQEKNFNLTILYKKAKQYFQKSDSVKAYWTRADDTFVNLYERPKISAKAKADLFVSLHMNSASASSAKGLEVYYSAKNTSKSSSGLTSKLMASYFQDSLISKIGCYDRGFKSAEYVVLKYNTVPSVLIELGFISNSQDLSRMKDSAKQTEAAKAIYDTVVEIFEKYPTGR
jgi:N-acetylmuramoyl-L-alanine amidase